MKKTTSTKAIENQRERMKILRGEMVYINQNMSKNYRLLFVIFSTWSWLAIFEFIDRFFFIFIIFVGLKNQMNPYTPVFGMYYSIWMMPNVNNNAGQFVTPYAFYPQFSQPHSINLVQQINQNLPPNQIIELNQNPPCQRKQQILIKDPPKNVQNEKQSKNTVQIQSKESKPATVKKISKNSKRPLLTYLTERAFYMKHKLKGKQKSGLRILRRRGKKNSLKITKKESQKSVKKTITEEVKIKNKKICSLKNPEKQKKIINKIRRKLLNQPQNEIAKLPKLISGTIQINDFCRTKLQNLMGRQIRTSIF